MIRSPSIPYVLPFGVFLGFLALHSVLPMPDLADQVVRVAVLTLVLLFFARPVLDFRVRRVAGTILIGVAVSRSGSGRIF